MSILGQTVKRMLPQRVRDSVRYVTDARYRGSIRASRARKHHRAQVDALVKQVAATLWDAAGGKVASGPFQGMSYIRGSVGSQWAPKLIGTYEMELASVIEEIVVRAPARIVDIGAAEGYYAVGLAWRLPKTRVMAYEIQEASHPLLGELAALNAVTERIQIRDACTADSLNESLGSMTHALVICDVEGAELELLDFSRAPALLHTDVLVEVHPWGHERMSQELRRRFQDTHKIRELAARPRTIADLPALAAGLPDHVALACMDETRPCPMSWLWMTIP